MGFSGMPDIVVWQENLDIASWVKNPEWPPYGHGQKINWYKFPQNRNMCMILLSTIGFSGMPVVALWSEMQIFLTKMTREMGLCCEGDSPHLLLLLYKLFW